MNNLSLILILLSLLVNIIRSDCPYSNPISDCLNTTKTLEQLCGIPDTVYAWYTGDTYNENENIWYDQGGYCRNIDSSFIINTITPYSDFNDQSYVTGSTSTIVYFPYDVLPGKFNKHVLPHQHMKNYIY